MFLRRRLKNTESKKRRREKNQLGDLRNVNRVNARGFMIATDAQVRE